MLTLACLQVNQIGSLIESIQATFSPPILNGQYFSTTLVVNPVCVNLQVNQIGSLTESIQAVKMSKAAGWGVMTSHR